MRRRGWIWALALVLMAGYVGWRCVRGGALETDLLAMLPRTERNPVAEQAIRSLASATGDRAIFLVSAGEPARSKAAARTLGEGLTRSGAFAQVQTTLPPVDSGSLLRFYLPHRFRLAPLEAGSAQDLTDRIQGRLASPHTGMLGVGPAQDPLGTLEAFLAGLPLGGLRMEIQDDLLVIQGPGGFHVLVSGSLKGSAFDPAVQKEVAGAVGRAERELIRAYPEARILRTGAVFYAIDARSSAEWETNLISGCSLLCIVALYLGVFRSFRHLVLGMACLLAGFIAASAACLLLTGRLYLLTLVCGASLLGVAVDYAFLFFAHHLAAGEAWRPRAALHRLLPALLVGLGTTLLGYGALLVAPFPGMRQMALFSLVGLVGSFLTVICILPERLERPLPPRPRLQARMERLLQAGRALARNRRAALALGGIALLLGVLATRARVDDDVHGLIRPSAALLAQEARIQALTGFANSGAFYLVEGADEGQVLAREEALRERLAPLVARGDVEGIQGLSAFVPSPARQEANLQSHLRAFPALAQALDRVGFRKDTAPALRAEQQASAARPLTLASWFELPLSVPYRMLWLGPTPQGRASVVYPQGNPRPEVLSQAGAHLPGVTFVDKAQSVTLLLGHYRRMASWALAGAVLLVGAVLTCLYGAARASATLGPALFGILLALAGLALTGTPVTLFCVLSLILVLGIGVDYSVFLLQGRDPASLLGVLLASLATLVSYGLLVASRTPALQGFGLTLTLGVVGSILTSYLALAPRPEDGA